VHQLPKRMNTLQADLRLIYFSNTFSICPTFFSTLPVFFSALPSASKLELFVTLPAVSLIHFMDTASNLVLSTWVHLFSPCC
jgi:hypothetical protein